MTQKSLFRYEEIADRVAGMIEKGTIRPGERVPSVRSLSSESGVSVSTVLQAYMALENRGLIEAKPQSGFYARLLSREIPPEPVITKTSLAAAPVNVGDLVSSIILAARNPDMIPLGAACPSPELFPTAKFQRVLSSVFRHAGDLVNTYDVAPGNPDFLRQIARRSFHWGCNLSAEDIVATCGCIEALNLCLRAVAAPGDVIAVESPTYFGVLQILESLKLKALEIPTHPREGIDLSALSAAIKRQKIHACLFMPTFHNPLGSCMPEENKKEMVSMLAAKEIPLVEDDIYGDLHFGTSRPKTAKSFDKQGLVLLCSSFSKVLSPGLRVGFTVPGRFKKQVERLKLNNTMGTGTIPQLVLAEFLKSGGYDRHLRRIRRAYSSQVQLMTQAIGKYFPEGTKVTRPAGGLVLWVELPKAVNSEDLHRRALEKNISIAPGTVFSVKGTYKNFIRLNCGQVWSDRLDRALLTLGQLATK